MPAEPPAALSRRALARGAAWSVPVIAIAAAAPAHAATPRPASYGTICRIFYGDGTVNAQRMQVFLGVAHDGSGYKLNTDYTWVFTFSNAVQAPSLPTGSWFTISSQLSADGKTLTIKVRFSTAPTTNPYCGSLSINWEPGTQLMPPGTQVTVTSFGLTSTGASLEAGSLVWKVPQRYAVSNGTGPNTPHYYISKSGFQTCYPEIQYSYFSKSGSTWTTCGVNGNDTSTVYPDGTCKRLTLTTGTQSSLAAVC